MNIHKHPPVTLFEDAKKPYNREQAIVEANRCLFCTDAPCMKACPTHIDIPQFIRKITTDNVENSAKTIFESNIFGVSCARACPVEVLCVGACVYNLLQEPPIQIGKLQLYATDKAEDKQWTFFTAGEDTGKSVGLIGAGPASLACAHALRVHGHRVTIYEKREIIGGLNTTGIAPYKMSTERALQEAQWVLDIGGIEVKTGVTVGEDLAIEELMQQHDALFFGMGLGQDTSLTLPGEDLPGVVGAVAMIEHLKLGQMTSNECKHCVVIGGGNTAIDAVREACGLGISKVTLVYRGTPQQMSGYAHEWKAAQLAGAKAEWQALPIAFHGKDHVESVECIRVDDIKQPILGTEFVIPADLVVVAIGQAKLGHLLASLPGVEIDKGCIVTDAEGRTGCKGIFAGGDCHNGGHEVVNAVAEGKTAAQAIHAYLTTGIYHG